MTLEQQLKIQAFLDGELPEREAREILAWTQRDREAALLLSEMRNTRQTLAKSESPWSLPESRDFFWSKIERELQRLEPETTSAAEVSIFAGLRRWLLPAGAGAALVIAGLFWQFNNPKPAGENVVDADTPAVETTLASAAATTYRDAGDGTTLVWFSDDNTAIN